MMTSPDFLTHDVEAVLNGRQMASIDVEMQCRGRDVVFGFSHDDVGTFSVSEEAWLGVPGQILDWRGRFGIFG